MANADVLKEEGHKITPNRHDNWSAVEIKGKKKPGIFAGKTEVEI